MPELSRWLHFVYISPELDHDLQRGCCRALTPGLSYLLLISKTFQKQWVQVCRNASGVVHMCTYWLTSRRKKRQVEKRAPGDFNLFSSMIIDQHLCIYIIHCKAKYYILLWKLILKIQQECDAQLKYQFNRNMRTRLKSNFTALSVIIHKWLINHF